MIQYNIGKETAIKLYGSKFYEELTLVEKATFQIFVAELCMPFDIFHEAVEKTIGCPVFTHEFATNIDVLQTRIANPIPTKEMILNIIPKQIRNKLEI